MIYENQTNMYLVNPVNTGMQDWNQTNISIIIPAYNCHNTIIQTLASIMMQENIHEIETIIADDCSDNTYDEIAKIFSNFMKIKVVRLKKGGGPGTARQVGYDHSVGSYVMFMDADDSLIGCDAINILKRVMIEKEQDCVYGQFLEQNENGDLITHEIHMIWMFGKLYRRSFLDHYNIRMNMSHSNEDTGYNCVVKGCSNKIWYIPKPVYTWRFKPNSITRFNNGMYGSESGMCGYLTNMIWQIKELEKRFVNKNYILEQIISIMCVLYHFYIENMQRYPLGSEANLEWIRYYYEKCYKPYEHLIEESLLNNIFAKVAADQDVAKKGIIPKITFFDFMKEIKSKPYHHDKMHDIGGSVIEIPQTTPENYPVSVNSYFNLLPLPVQNTNTNLSRMDGMKRALEDDKKQREEFLKEKILPEVKDDNNNSTSNPIEYRIPVPNSDEYKKLCTDIQYARRDRFSVRIIKSYADLISDKYKSLGDLKFLTYSDDGYIYYILTKSMVLNLYKEFKDIRVVDRALCIDDDTLLPVNLEREIGATHNYYIKTPSTDPDYDKVTRCIRKKNKSKFLIINIQSFNMPDEFKDKRFICALIDGKYYALTEGLLLFLADQYTDFYNFEFCIKDNREIEIMSKDEFINKYSSCENLKEREKSYIDFLKRCSMNKPM